MILEVKIVMFLFPFPFINQCLTFFKVRLSFRNRKVFKIIEKDNFLLKKKKKKNDAKNLTFKKKETMQLKVKRIFETE